MSALLPCPFCSEEDTERCPPMVLTHKNKGDPAQYFTVQCTHCGCEPDYCVESPDDAIDHWNLRRINSSSHYMYKNGFLDGIKEAKKLLSEMAKEKINRGTTFERQS